MQESKNLPASFICSSSSEKLYNDLLTLAFEDKYRAVFIDNDFIEPFLREIY